MEHRCKTCGRTFEYGDENSPMFSYPIWKRIIDFYGLAKYEKEAETKFYERCAKYNETNDPADKEACYAEDCHTYICYKCAEIALGRKIQPDDLMKLPNGSDVPLNKEFIDKVLEMDNVVKLYPQYRMMNPYPRILSDAEREVIRYKAAIESGDLAVNKLMIPEFWHKLQGLKRKYDELFNKFQTKYDPRRFSIPGNVTDPREYAQKLELQRMRDHSELGSVQTSIDDTCRKLKRIILTNEDKLMAAMPPQES